MPHLHGRPTLGGVAHAQECLVQRADQPLGCPTLGEALPADRDALRWAIPCPQGLPAYRDAPSTGMTRPLLCSASGKLHPWGLPAYRDALPWGMSHPHGLPAYRDAWMSREDWPLGRRGPEGGRPGGREDQPSRTRCSSLAPGSSLGMVFVAADRGCSAPCCPRPGLYPKEMAAPWARVQASKARRRSLASDGRAAAWLHDSSWSCCAHGASVLQARRPRPPGRTGRAPDEAQSAWQPSEPGCAPAPTVVKLASRPVRVARVEPRQARGDPHLPSGYSCDQSAGRRAACVPRAVAACSYCVVNVEDPEQARSPRLPHPRGMSTVRTVIWGLCGRERAPEGPGRPRGAPHPGLCPGGLPGLLLADDHGCRACHPEGPGPR